MGRLFINAAFCLLAGIAFFVEGFAVLIGMGFLFAGLLQLLLWAGGDGTDQCCLDVGLTPYRGRSTDPTLPGHTSRGGPTQTERWEIRTGEHSVTAPSQPKRTDSAMRAARTAIRSLHGCGWWLDGRSEWLG